MHCQLVKTEKAAAVENLIASIAMQGKLPGRINEGRLIEMLEGLGGKQNTSTSSRISIQRKQYAFDSDDEDDDDLM
jgi:DNA-binding TFAR19-related protein (PDSD5 family)